MPDLVGKPIGDADRLGRVRMRFVRQAGGPASVQRQHPAPGTGLPTAPDAPVLDVRATMQDKTGPDPFAGVASSGTASDAPSGSATASGGSAPGEHRLTLTTTPTRVPLPAHVGRLRFRLRAGDGTPVTVLLRTDFARNEVRRVAGRSPTLVTLPVDNGAWLELRAVDGRAQVALGSVAYTQAAS